MYKKNFSAIRFRVSANKSYPIPLTSLMRYRILFLKNQNGPIELHIESGDHTMIETGEKRKLNNAKNSILVFERGSKSSGTHWRRHYSWYSGLFFAHTLKERWILNLPIPARGLGYFIHSGGFHFDLIKKRLGL